MMINYSKLFDEEYKKEIEEEKKVDMIKVFAEDYRYYQATKLMTENQANRKMSYSKYGPLLGKNIGLLYKLVEGQETVLDIIMYYALSYNVRKNKQGIEYLEPVYEDWYWNKNAKKYSKKIVKPFKNIITIYRKKTRRDHGYIKGKDTYTFQIQDKEQFIRNIEMTMDKLLKFAEELTVNVNEIEAWYLILQSLKNGIKRHQIKCVCLKKYEIVADNYCIKINNGEELHVLTIDWDQSPMWCTVNNK